MALPTVPPPAAAWLFQELIDARLMAADRAAKALAEFQAAGAAGGDDAAALAEFLVQAGLLTPFQANRALAGLARNLALGPYTLAEPVGSGSMGTVYRAVHRTTRDRYAVKVLPLRSMWNVIQAKQQVGVFAALKRHPSVVPFVDIDTVGGSHYLAWPFVEGETIEAHVRRAGPLPPTQAARFAADVADGLAVCHRQDVVHGLLKPSNLMLGPDRRARILDLGIGAILQDNVADSESLLDTISTANTAMTMIDCAAPETLADPTQRTRAGDLYSLGCVLHFLITGQVPFPEGNTVDKIIAHQTRAPQPVGELVPGVPAALEAVILHCLAKNPADRPAHVEAVRDALLAAVPEALPTSGPSLADIPAPAFPANEPAPWSPSPSDETAFDPESVLPMLTPAARPTSSTRRGPDSASLDLFEREGSESVTDTPVSPRAVSRPTPPQPAPTRLTRPPSVANWSAPPSDTSLSGVTVPPPPSSAKRSWWSRVCRLIGLAPSRDVVQLSLFGPLEITPGQTHRFQVYAHPPEAFASVRTLSRAFQPDTSLRGAGYASKPVSRFSELGLHLAVAHAGVVQSLVRFKWVGQTRPWAFEVYVPWESPAGPTVGLLTVGVNNQQSSEIPFELMILPRSG